MALVFNEDNYYLTCYSPRHDSTVNYRVDRMDRVEVLSEDACEKTLSLRGEVATYTEQAFKMFGGETADLVLDNGGVLGDASFLAADGSMVGPTSTSVGAAILQAIVCRVKELSIEEGFEADFFKSSNVDGGDEWNDGLIEHYKDMIPGLF